MGLTVEAVTFDVGFAAPDAAAWSREIIARVRQSWATGADVVLLPEYLWMGLERFVSGDPGSPVRNVAGLFWGTLWALLRAELTSETHAVVLGTVPFIDDTGRVRNRAPILAGGRALFQDKLTLTPWESAMAGGGDLWVWEFRGLRIAVLVCLDVEIPEYSAALRGRGIDLLLVPSATETLLGTERIARCASARAVELGCWVAVSHLTGRCQSALVDENIGRVAWFAPSQSAFAGGERMRMTEPVAEGIQALRFCIDPGQLSAMRRARGETNPALCTPAVDSLAVRDYSP